MPSRFPRRFFARDTVTVARALLGQLFFHDTPEGRRAGQIVEVEAYAGPQDPASHAFRGPTARSRIMFGPAGYLYVYFIYGIYFCCNVVTEGEGRPGAVLIRGLRPLAGVDIMRAEQPHRPLHRLANGPGKVCRALAITLAHNGRDLVHGSIGIAPLTGAGNERIVAGPRIGITRGTELPYRFWLRPSASPAGRSRELRGRRRSG